MRLLIVDDDAARLLRTTFEVVDVEVDDGTGEAALRPSSATGRMSSCSTSGCRE